MTPREMEKATTEQLRYRLARLDKEGPELSAMLRLVTDQLEDFSDEAQTIRQILKARDEVKE